MGCSIPSHSNEISDFQALVATTPSNDVIHAAEYSVFEVSSLSAEMVGLITPPPCSLLPVDPFGISTSNIMYYLDLCISKAFSSLDGGLEL